MCHKKSNYIWRKYEGLRKGIKIKTFAIFLTWLMILAHSIIPHTHIEKDISDAEASLSESKLDEDKLLEQNDLNDVEKKTKDPQADAFESLDEIEKDIGRKYLDEDLNSKENPYGLTEFDLEEIDELLNTDTAKDKVKGKK